MNKNENKKPDVNKAAESKSDKDKDDKFCKKPFDHEFARPEDEDAPCKDAEE